MIEIDHSLKQHFMNTITFHLLIFYRGQILANNQFKPYRLCKSIWDGILFYIYLGHVAHARIYSNSFSFRLLNDYERDKNPSDCLERLTKKHTIGSES